MTTNNFSNLAYELINDKYSKAKYLGIECIMETKTGYINATKFCIKVQESEDEKKAQETRVKKAGDGKKAQETQVKKAGDGKKAQETQDKKAGNEKKMFKDYLRLDRYKKLFNYMRSAAQNCAAISMEVRKGDNSLSGTYVHPDLLLDLASWISPEAYIKASRIVRNFLVREKEDEIIRLSRDKSRLEKMFEESDKRREEADKRAENDRLERKESDKRREEAEKRAEQDRLERKEAEKRAEQMMLEMTLQNKEALQEMTLQNKETHVKLDETKITLQETHVKLDKTNVKLDKTKINLRRVEARVDILVEEVVPPAKKVSLHEQFGIMKLNDSEGKREYKVYCVQTRGVCKARASILKEYPKAVLIKEVKPNANAKNFLHKLKEKYGSGKKAMINVSYNFIKLKDRVTEKELIEAIDEVVGEAKNFGV